MALKLKTAPATEPITTAEGKVVWGVPSDDNTRDTLIDLMIAAVRQRCEEFLGRALITQTWTLWLNDFPKRTSKRAPQEGYFELPVNYFDEHVPEIEIPRPPLQSVTHVKYYTTDDAANTFAASNYFVDTVNEPGRVALNYNVQWPSATLRPANAVEVEFVAGYGASASDVPAAIRAGLLGWLKVLFANNSRLFESDEPASLAEVNMQNIPPQVRAIWQPYKMINL